MTKRTLPAKGTEERAFLEAMCSNTMGLQPEWVQAPGNQKISGLVQTLRAMGWDVQAVELDAPIGYIAHRVVLHFLDDMDSALEALHGDFEERCDE